MILSSLKIGAGWAALVENTASNIDQTNREMYAAWYASISKGNLSIAKSKKNQAKILRKLEKESVHGVSTPWEFIPMLDIYLDYQQRVELERAIDRTTRYPNSTTYKEDIAYRRMNYANFLLNSNARFRKHNNLPLLNNTPEEVEDYKVVLAYLPWKVIYQLRTHRSFQWLVSTTRIGFQHMKFDNLTKDKYTQEQKDAFEEALQSVVEAWDKLLDSKQVDKEDANLLLPDNRMQYVLIGGFMRNHRGWEAMLKERKHNAYDATKKTVQTIDRLLDGKSDIELTTKLKDEING